MRDNYPYVKRNIKKLLDEGHMRLYGWLSPDEYEKLHELKDKFKQPSLIQTVRYLINTKKI